MVFVSFCLVLLFHFAYHLGEVLSCSGVSMDLSLLEELVWYKDDVVGMVETRRQRKKKNKGDRKDYIHKHEHDITMREFKAFQSFQRLTL